MLQRKGDHCSESHKERVPNASGPVVDTNAAVPQYEH